MDSPQHTSLKQHATTPRGAGSWSARRSSPPADKWRGTRPCLTLGGGGGTVAGGLLSPAETRCRDLEDCCAYAWSAQAYRSILIVIL